MRAQVSIEFFATIMVVIFIMTIALAYIFSLRADVDNQASINAVNDLAYSIQQEISLAAIMYEGYARTLELPDEINNKDYQVTILGGNLYVEQESYQIILPLPDVDGNLSQTTTIRSTSSGVELS